MALNLSNISQVPGARRAKRRIGRGNASGHGTYSTKGIKGQKSRSGVSGLRRLGMKAMLLQAPKARGFKSHYIKNQVVNLDAISKVFKTGDIISPATLAKKGLVENVKGEVKILAKGELTLEKLVFAGVLVSETAAKAIAAKGGKINS